MIRLILILFISISLCCCKQRSDVNTDGVVTVEIDNISFDPPVLLQPDKYFDSIRYVKLETNKESAISVISGVHFVDDKIIISDNKSKSIFIFNRDGQYLSKIHRVGRGPGEYLSVYSVMVDAVKHELMVYDIDTRKLIRYDFDGNHIRTIENFSDGDVIRDIINTPSGDFLCYRQDYDVKYKDRAGVWKVDSNGVFQKFIYEITDVYPLNLSSVVHNLSKLSDNEISFVDRNQTNIYSIKSDTVFQRVAFKMPQKTMADFVGIKKTDESFVAILFSEEKGDYIFTQWSGFKGNIIVNTVFCKSTQATDVGVAFMPFLGKDMFFEGASKVKNNSSNIRVSSLSPRSVYRYFDEKYPEEYRAPVRELLEGMTDQEIENANPIIQLCFIK